MRMQFYLVRFRHNGILLNIESSLNVFTGTKKNKWEDHIYGLKYANMAVHLYSVIYFYAIMTLKELMGGELAI